jgi:hypothetical protein
MLMKRNFLALLILAIFFHQFLFLSSHYKVNDDNGMAMIASGGFDGVPSGRLVYVNYVLGFLLSRLYILVPDVSWYAVFQVQSVLLSALVFYKTFTRYFRLVLGGRSDTYLTGVVFLIVVLLLKWNMSSINYSSTAFQCSVFGLGSLLLAVKGNFTSLIWFSGFVAVLGFLWRQGSFLGALIFFIPLIIISFFFDGRGRVIKVWFSLASVILSTYFLNSYMYFSDSAWADYSRYNRARGLLHGNLSFEKVINGQNFVTNLADAGITRESFNLFIDWFIEPKTMKLEAIRYLGSLIESPKISAIFLEMVSTKTMVPIVGATFFVCVASLFFKLRLKFIITLTLINSILLAIFWSYFLLAIRLPSYVAAGIRLSFLVVLLVTLLIFSQTKISNVQSKTIKYRYLPHIMTSIFVFAVLVSFADWRTDQELELKQEKFEKNYQSLVNENRKPIYPIPSILDFSNADPYTPQSLFKAKIITYGWLNGSPIADQALGNLQLASTVSESFLNGNLLLAQGSLSESIEPYLMDLYGICGRFKPVESQVVQTYVFQQDKCSDFENSFGLIGNFSYDEMDTWSMSPDFKIIFDSCQGRDFLKTVTFGLFSPFGPYATDRLVAIEYVDEFGVEKSENFSVKAFENNRFTIRTLGCRIVVVSLTKPVIPFQVNPEYQDQRTLYLGISNPSLLTGYRHIFKQ